MSQSLFINHLNEHLIVANNLHTLDESVIRVGLSCAAALKQGGKILFCGNGGSAADSQHLAAELTGRFIGDRRPLAAIALSTDTSALTCIGNDYGFDHVFSRQVEALGNESDVLLAISTSGQSQNIINAVEVAIGKKMVAIGLLGKDGGTLKSICTDSIVIPSQSTARVQECHILIGHVICAIIERELGFR